MLIINCFVDSFAQSPASWSIEASQDVSFVISHALSRPWETVEKLTHVTLAPSGLRQFAALAVSPSLSVALRLCGEMGTPHPIKPALGSLRSSENWQQRGIREFFNSLLGSHLKPVIFDDRIRQEIAGNFMEFGLIGAAWQLDFDVLSDADAPDVFESEMFHGLCGGRALRVEHGGLGHHDDDGFHGETISCPDAGHKSIMIFWGPAGDRTRAH
jgi:hypothetical protein